KRGSEGPPISAFELNYSYDEIVESLKEQGITNSKTDRVKVVFYPTYLSVGDKLLSMEYEDMVVASSAGFFPSYYEPWGYTPVETAANGALSVTSDLAGFGQFLLEETNSSSRKGIQVLRRKNREHDKVVEDLARTIEDFLSFDKTEITERKHNARKLAQLTSWEKLGENYRQAHKMAVKKMIETRSNIETEYREFDKPRPYFAVHDPGIEGLQSLDKDFDNLVVIGNGGSVTSFRAL
ncbi:starch synthase, partial [Candidatus Haloredivivus sp. G17]